MSQTISSDAVGPSRWGYMASVMSEVLGNLLQTKRNDPEQIPIGVLNAAQLFFKLVGEVLEGEQIPENPQASVANYKIAADTIRASESPAPTTTELERRIREYGEFLSTLRARRELSAQELEVARHLNGFFHELATEGAAEEYEQFASASMRGTPFA